MANDEDRDSTNACSECRQLEFEGPDPVEYAVAPDDGGGWEAWAAALTRFFRRLGPGPTQAVVVTQEPVTERYVQVLVGHGLAHAEASSNVYLEGDSRLTPEIEAVLPQLGWEPPHSDADTPDEMPANWTLPIVEGDWEGLVEVLLTTVLLLGFAPGVPVRINSFQATWPCRRCSWGDPDEDDVTPEAA